MSALKPPRYPVAKRPLPKAGHDSGRNPKSKTKTPSGPFTLKTKLSLDDHDWTFNDIPSLPTPQELNDAGLIKTIVLQTDIKKSTHSMLLRLEQVDMNRAIESDPLDRFVLVSLEGFRPLIRSGPSASKPSPPDAPKTREAGHPVASDGPPFIDDPLQPQTGRDISDYSIRFLRAGITLQHEDYNFYGHSNSQLKSRSCFLFAAPKDRINTKVEALGDFSRLKTVGKKAKRIGLLFSAAKAVTVVRPEQCQDIGDVETAAGEYVFTDGCGLIAPKLARELARRMRVVFRDKRYTPSVFQIRYRGYKGVVTLDPRMTAAGQQQEREPLLKLRKSMKKFSGGENHSFAVVEHSKPFSYGFLNDETVLLLNALGISNNTLLRKQNEHFDLLTRALTDFRSAFSFLASVNRPDLAERVLMEEGLEPVRPQIKRLINAERAKMLNKREEQRCRIFVRKSRLLFGVCDAWDVLKEGECAVKVTMEGDGQPYTLKGAEVSVIRNPCLHPGDWQKFRAVEKPELSHLVDCIVFSTRGRRPAADLMSGGDLDGDTFFVCWDPELIPSVLSQPALYPGGKDPVQFKPVTDDDRLVYFAKYTNASLGQVKNLYLDWARSTGPMSPQCQELNRLFSQSVDGNRIKIPDKLRRPTTAKSQHLETSTFILDMLHEAAKKSAKTIIIETAGQDRAELDGFDVEAMQLIMTRDDIAMTEFEFILLFFKWCQRNEVPFEDLLHLFDFNVLTSVEKLWVLGHVPVSRNTPSLVLNGLCSSNIISHNELSHFGLDHAGIRWKCVYDSSRDRLATFHDAAARNMELFTRTLVVFRPDERLSLAMYFPKKIERAQDCLIDDSGRLFAFPHSQGRERQSRLSLPTKMRYRVYCDGNVFQLFEDQRANSWIYLARPGENDEEYRNIEDRGDRRRQRQATVDRGVNFDVRASVALDKFSKGLQRHIGRVNRSQVSAAEIYIISNRDVASMQNLDLWLQYIETSERLPLFPQEPREYATLQPQDVIDPSDPSWVEEIVQQHDLSVLLGLQKVEDYVKVFEILQLCDSRNFLVKCFEHILGNAASVKVGVQPLLQAMVNFLTKEPLLVVTFSQGLENEGLQEHLKSLLQDFAAPILRAFILSANTSGFFIIEPLKLMLSKILPGSLSFKSFTSLLELVALTVRVPELALDILLECIEPEARNRLLVGEAAVVNHFVRNLIAIAIDHVGESTEGEAGGKTREDLLELTLHPKQDDDGYKIIQIEFRIDAPGGTPRTSSHVRLTAASPPVNTLVDRRYSMDTLVTFSEAGRARFKCYHPLPPYFSDCSWTLEDCGPFVTTKTMLDAVTALDTSLETCCGVAGPILGRASAATTESGSKGIEWQRSERLNESQNEAIQAALRTHFVCLWGPPGTGKTETIVEMICALQETYPEARVLVTAPTHNAVDNAMRRYVRRVKEQAPKRVKEPSVLRVSTEVRKVSQDLRQHTCDALAGQEIYANRRAMDQAVRAIKRSDTVFTTCIGAGIGLLRTEQFGIVIVDEASQQTEPASLVPLVKGCSRAVLVGDHVQLRPTVMTSAAALDFDVSLFERLYVEGQRRSRESDGDEQLRSSGHGGNRDDEANTGMKTLMLDTQYRMHPDICAFSSEEFYEGRLKTGIKQDDRPLPPCVFPFPLAKYTGAEGVARSLSAASLTVQKTVEHARALFIDCSARETPGGKSKENMGQAELCKRICQLLTTPPPLQPPATPSPNSQDAKSPEQASAPAPSQLQPSQPFSIAVLTPYTRQAELLKRMLSDVSSSGNATIEVSSIDGFQGREADAVVLVTVRCNEHAEIGFLKDTRRMNVALTRARALLVVVGSRATLTGGGVAAVNASAGGSAAGAGLAGTAGGPAGGLAGGAAGGQRPGEPGKVGAEAEPSKLVWKRLLSALVEVKIDLEV